MKKVFKRFVATLAASLTIVAFTCQARAMPVFSDVLSDAWYSESVAYVLEHRLMNGTSETTFEPDGSITRGMLVTVIYRLAGEPSVVGSTEFVDISEGDYYYLPIIWANANGIVNGYSKEIFAPDDMISREQFATILYRYASYMAPDFSCDFGQTDTVKKYGDSDLISGYAKEAMNWANSAGLITGTASTTLDPLGTATRAQAATILTRFDKLLSGIRADDNDSRVDSGIPQEGGNQEKPSDLLTDDTEVPGVIIRPGKEPQDTDSTEEGEKTDHSGITGGEGKEEADNKDSAESERTEVYIKVENAEAVCGETAVIDISLKNNPGIMGMLISFEYDEQAMKLTEIKNGEVLSGSNGYVFTSPRNPASGCRASWYTLEDECASDDGVLVTLVFEISESASVGSYPITVLYGSDDIIDAAQDTLTPDIINGKIIVK